METSASAKREFDSSGPVSIQVQSGQPGRPRRVGAVADEVAVRAAGALGA